MSTTFMQLILRGLETGSVYALATLGIILIARTSSITNFAQGTIATFNIFVVAWLCSIHHFPLWASILCGIGSAVITGFLVDFFVIRRTRKVAPLSKQIITLGLIMIFSGITPMLFGVDPFPLDYLIPSGGITIGGAALSYNSMFNIIVVALVMIGLFYILQKTKLGIAIRATASNEPIARLMGIRTRKVTLFSWALAAVLGCLAGVMVAPATTVSMNVMAGVQMNALFACVLGGVQTFYGAVIAAYILGVGKNLMVYYVSIEWGEQLLFLLILLVLMIRPYGLFGQKIVKKV